MKKKFKFIDLFCGIGGFHQAMTSLGGRCVFACDIDKDCRKTYFENYGLEPAGDITKVDETKVPVHDVLCGGFPCQAFSKAGKRLGFDDPTKGTLFFDVMRIIRAKRPKYVLLENVRNLASHDGGNTWRVIWSSLTDAGYDVPKEPVIFSPHYLGVPQHRERVFIMGIRKDVGELPEFCFNTENLPSCSINSIREPMVDSKYNLKDDEIALLEHWNKFIKNTRSSENKLPGFPVWTEWFRDASVSEYSGQPKWKQSIIARNIDYYKTNREFIDKWIEDGKQLKLFFGSKAKFEWQVGVDDKEPEIWHNIIQFRPSGVRVKPGTYFPALVAMVQRSIIGIRKRYMTPRECARIQGFPDTFKLDPKEMQAYKQFGNSVNVDVVKLFASFLMDIGDVRDRYSRDVQFPNENKTNELF